MRPTHEEPAVLDIAYLNKIEAYIASGDLAQDFECSPEERRIEMLEFLEKLMDLGEAADKVATEVIFKGSYLGAMVGMNDQK
jgi:hypothetical protein